MAPAKVQVLDTYTPWGAPGQHLPEESVASALMSTLTAWSRASRSRACWTLMRHGVHGVSLGAQSAARALCLPSLGLSPESGLAVSFLRLWDR